MKKLNVAVLALAALVSANANAAGNEDNLLEQNAALEAMRHKSEKLALQAQMSKSYKEMSDAGVLVDEDGVPLGIGDMEAFAAEVRARGGKVEGAGAGGFDPFGGLDPVFGGGTDVFGGNVSMPSPAVPANKEATTPDPKVEVVAKPSEREKKEGKILLRLVEIRGNSAVFFTNDGFSEVSLGGSIYNQKVTKIGVDSVSLKGNEGTRVLRIDWTQSVRYADD